MSQRISQNVIVGLLVLVGSFFFLVALYLIGSKDNMFTSGFRIYSKFNDVKGLLVGNNI
jgi:phospholipid/cholesterol/gamma-HCH transport system substrate-binding protein